MSFDHTGIPQFDEGMGTNQTIGVDLITDYDIRYSLLSLILRVRPEWADDDAGIEKVKARVRSLEEFLNEAG